MNEKEVRFLVINTKALWEEGLLEDLEITDEGLGLKKVFTHKYVRSYQETGSPATFALDRCGLIYLIDESGSVMVFDPRAVSCGLLEPLPATGLQGLAAGRSNLYICDSSRVYALAKVNYQIRWEAAVPGPVAPALDRAENLYLLDRAAGRVFKAGRGGTVSVLIDSLVSPLAICCGQDGFLYILYEAEIQRFFLDGMLQETIPLSLPVDLAPACLAVDRGGVIYLGGWNDEGFPYLLDNSGNWERLGYQGAVYQIAINDRGDLYLLGREKGSGQKQIVLLERVANYVGKGAYTSKWFDSDTAGCRWRRFLLDVEIPENTQFLVSCSTSEFPDDPAAAFGEELVNPTEALITSPAGRYIRFRFRFFSKDVVRTPRLKIIKVYFPRVSYLRYLPAVYQENAQGKDFLERFLAIGEAFFTGLEEEIQGITAFFDPAAAPEGFLPWISSWLAVTSYDKWPAPKIRALLQRAPVLYQKRGTREGIEEMITLYMSRVSENGRLVDDTGAKPIIVESFQVRNGESEAGAIWGDLFGTDPYSFCVLLKPEQVVTAQDLHAVKRIVEFEKPAYTRAGVKLLRPWFYLDWHTYLGINTCLTRQGFILGKCVLSRDTAVAEWEEGGEVEVRSRVEVDTVLT